MEVRCLLGVVGLQSVLKSSVNFLISSSGLAWRSANSSLNAAHSSQPGFSLERLATARSEPDIVPHTDPRAVLIWTERDDMLARRPTFVLNQFAAQPYVDVVHSTSHGSSVIYEITENTLHSSVHERVHEFPQTAPLLVSCATLQLRGWIPPAPPASATCYPSARPRHPVGYRSRAVAAVQAQGSTPTAPSPGSSSGSPGSKLKSSRPTDARGCLGAQHQSLQISVWVSIPPRAWRPGGDSVCASSNPHRCLETRGVSLRCTSPLQPDRSRLSSSLFANTAVPLLHLHQRCARQSCFEELKRIIVVESHELSVLVSPHLSVVLAIDFCTVAILSSVLDNCCWNS